MNNSFTVILRLRVVDEEIGEERGSLPVHGLSYLYDRINCKKTLLMLLNHIVYPNVYLVLSFSYMCFMLVKKWVNTCFSLWDDDDDEISSVVNEVEYFQIWPRGFNFVSEHRLHTH